MLNNCIVVPGSSNIPLAQNIAKALQIPIAEIEISKFACSETRVRVLSEISGKTVLLVQSLSSPANDHLVELMLIADAVKRMSPRLIYGIIPWLGYAPQDKVFRVGEPLSSEVVVRMLENVGIHRFIICDIHSNLVIDKFKNDITHIRAQPVFVNLLLDVIEDKNQWVVAILDKGNAERSMSFASDLGIELVRFEKERDRNTGKVTFHRLSGDVRNKHVLIYDDYISTGQTLLDSAQYAKKLGALTYTCCVTHVAVTSTMEKLNDSHIDCFITTNSIHFGLPANMKKVTILDSSKLFAKIIHNHLSK